MVVNGFQLRIYTDLKTLIADTEDMEWRFREEDRLQHPEECRGEPGYIQAVAEALLQELELDAEEGRALVDNARRGETSPDG